VLDHLELTNGHLNVIMTDNAFLNNSKTSELQPTLDISAIEWPAMRNHIPCMVYHVQLPLVALESNLSVNGHPNSWEARERDQQLVENEQINILKSQRLRNAGNA